MVLDECPFCKKPLEIIEICFEVFPRRINSDEIRVHCYHCGALGPSGISKEEAAREWNERTGRRVIDGVPEE